MRNVSRDQIALDFEELVADNQIPTAVELLISADPEDQLLIVRHSPMTFERLLHALSWEERKEVIDRMAPEATQRLAEVLQVWRELTATHARRQAPAVPSPSPGDFFTASSAGRRDFQIVDGRIIECGPGQGSVTLYSNPSPQEQRALIEGFEIDEHSLASALDPDEISRLEFDQKRSEAFIVWTRPQTSHRDNPEFLGLASMGFFLEADYLTIVTEDERPLVRGGDRADSVRNLLLRLMVSTVNEFLLELKRTKRTSQEIGQKLSRSLENRQLLKMFDLSEGLIYQINALEANGGVLRRLRALAPQLGFDEAEIGFLDDIIVDSMQCITQAQTFLTILAGLMDARGSLVNNNMNVLLRNLTVINLIFLPLGVIASMGGMSEYSEVLDRLSVSWGVGYALFTLAMVGIGYGLIKAVNFWVNQRFED